MKGLRSKLLEGYYIRDYVGFRACKGLGFGV